MAWHQFPTNHFKYLIRLEDIISLVICGLETTTMVKMSLFLSCRFSCFRVDPFYVFTNKTKPFLSFWPCSVNSNWTWYLQQTTHHLWRATRLCSRTFTVLLYVNDIHKSSDKLAFYLFANDTNLLCADKNLRTLELVVNLAFHKVYEWLTAYKLTLNFKKSNFILLYTYWEILTKKVCRKFSYAN